MTDETSTVDLLDGPTTETNPEPAPQATPPVASGIGSVNASGVTTLIAPMLV